MMPVMDKHKAEATGARCDSFATPKAFWRTAMKKSGEKWREVGEN